MIRIAGLASIWWFDDGRGLYMRMPRIEAPRELAEWGDVRAGPCQDFVWHGLDSWWVTADGSRLVVVPVAHEAFWAPLTQEADGHTFDLWDELVGRRDGAADPRRCPTSKCGSMGE